MNIELLFETARTAVTTSSTTTTITDNDGVVRYDKYETTGGYTSVRTVDYDVDIPEDVDTTIVTNIKVSDMKITTTVMKRNGETNKYEKVESVDHYGNETITEYTNGMLDFKIVTEKISDTIVRRTTRYPDTQLVMSIVETDHNGNVVYNVITRVSSDTSTTIINKSYHDNRVVFERVDYSTHGSNETCETSFTYHDGYCDSVKTLTRADGTTVSSIIHKTIGIPGAIRKTTWGDGHSDVMYYNGTDRISIVDEDEIRVNRRFTHNDLCVNTLRYKPINGKSFDELVIDEMTNVTIDDITFADVLSVSKTSKSITDDGFEKSVTETVFL